MRRFVIYALLAAAGSLLSALAMGEKAAPPAAEDASQPDVAAIQALYSAWNDAVESADIPGYLAVLDPDVELMPTDAPPILGRDHYGTFLQPVFQNDSFEIEVAVAPQVEVDGGFAYARYDYIIHRMPVGGDDRISSYRKFLDVLRRQPDGSWRVFKHIWNYNDPGTTP